MPQDNRLLVRNIELHFILESGKFSSGGNVKIVKGVSDDPDSISIQAIIKRTTGLQQDECSLVVFGLLEQDLAQLSTLTYQVLQLQKNRLLIYAGYDEQSALIFNGTIMSAVGDYGEVDRPFTVIARTGYFETLALAPHTNVKGETTANTVFSNLATNANLSLIDSAKTELIRLYNHILTGGTGKQIQTLADQLNLDAKNDGSNLYITPRNAPIHNAVIDLNDKSGLLGYPKINQNGVMFRMRFNPNIRWGMRINLQSSAPNASGSWRVYGLEYNLTNLHEKFEITIQGSRYGFGF